ncbi:MAG: hypothetical protein E7279_06545 [Lachnospiraceae bacterium]|nr:hypothetical protein [Lachnospiraceae bacterium]
MDKIYRRETQIKSTEKKVKNEKNRVRNMILNFRVTPIEKEMIEARIRITGLPKAEFFIKSCLYQELSVVGNVRTFSEMRNRIDEIYSIMKCNPYLDELDDEHRESLRIILELLVKVFNEEVEE